MNRREALSAVTIITGSVVFGASAFLSGCKTKNQQSLILQKHQLELLDEVVDTFLPSVAGISGAKDAKVSEFINTYLSDCCSLKEQEIFLNGLNEIDKISEKSLGRRFVHLSNGQKHAVLLSIAKDAKKGNADAQYFYMLRQFTLLGYYSSEVGATKVLRYQAVPGKWEPCIPYKTGQKSWSL